MGNDWEAMKADQRADDPKWTIDVFQTQFHKIAKLTLTDPLTMCHIFHVKFLHVQSTIQQNPIGRSEPVGL